MKIRCEKCRALVNLDETYGLCPKCNYYNTPPNTTPDLDETLSMDYNSSKFIDIQVETKSETNYNSSDSSEGDVSTGKKISSFIKGTVIIYMLFILFGVICEIWSSQSRAAQATATQEPASQIPYSVPTESSYSDFDSYYDDTQTNEEFEKCDLPVNLIIEDNVVVGYSNPPNIISTQIVIPEGVTAIADNAFVDCLDAELLILSSTVERIGGGAFLGLSNLKYIYLFSDNLEVIEDFAFYNVKPEQLYFPPNVKYLGDYAMNEITLEAPFLEGVETIGENAINIVY